MKTFDLQAMIDSKQAFQKQLARLPIAEKLAMLDALRERTLAIRAAAERAHAASHTDQTTPDEPGE
jgi:hypothetical protein